MKISETFVKLREACGLSQAELSRRAGLAPTSVGQIERHGAARISSLIAIAGVLGVNPTDLLQDAETTNDLAFPVYLDPGAMLPKRAHSADAGFDLYAPKMDLVPKHGSTVIDTGVHIAIPKGCAGILISKSGLNLKHGIVSDGLIDSGYTGSIKVKLYNFSGESYFIERGDKISQIVFIPVCEPYLYSVDEPLEKTERGDGGFGSTGR